MMTISLSKKSLRKSFWEELIQSFSLNPNCLVLQAVFIAKNELFAFCLYVFFYVDYFNFSARFKRRDKHDYRQINFKCFYYNIDIFKFELFE